MPLRQYCVEPIELTRRMDAYDGSPDGDDWYAQIAVPMGIPRWNFTLAEIDGQSFSQLQDLLGAKNFQKIVATQGYINPPTQFGGYRGEDNLQLRYYIRATDRSNIQELFIVSFGEYQPARWLAHIEGLWQITEVTDYRRADRLFGANR
jgi:hypothetical protein